MLRKSTPATVRRASAPGRRNPFAALENLRSPRSSHAGIEAGRHLLLAPALHRGGNAQRLAVLGHRAPGDVDAVALELLDDLVVGQHRRRPSRRRSAGGCGGARLRTSAPRSPSAEAIAEVKKYLSSNTPRGVAMYLLEVTRLTVDSCIEMASATVFRLSGFRCSMPWVRKPSCWRTISSATRRMVRARWSRLLTSQLAFCRQSMQIALVLARSGAVLETVA